MADRASKRVYNHHSLEEILVYLRAAIDFRGGMCGDPVEEEGCQSPLEEESTAREKVGGGLSLVLPSVPG